MKKGTPVPKKGLTPRLEKKLFNSLVEFAVWIVQKKIIPELPNIYIESFPFADEDWVMRFDPKTGAVSFNTSLSNNCSFEYFTSIILHEFFHLAVQRVPNKEDATKIKDDFGDELMKIIDLEADFFTALFYKEHWGYGLVQYLKLYYESTTVFRDKWIRVGKFERFVGTLLGISKMFLTHLKKSSKVTTYDIYLLSISPFFTEENLHVLVLRKEHIYFDIINATMSDLMKIRECYTNNEEYNQKTYTSKIVTFVGKALNIEIPKSITDEILKIK